VQRISTAQYFADRVSLCFAFCALAETFGLNKPIAANVETCVEQHYSPTMKVR
jgi:hypothetical protein